MTGLSLAFIRTTNVFDTLSVSHAVAMTVRMTRELQRHDGERPSERSTRHIEIALPSGVSYSAGDHLGIVPRNGLGAIQRVLLRFKLDPSLYATIVPRANADTHLPVDEPVPLLGILANYRSDPCSKRIDTSITCFRPTNKEPMG